MKYITMKSICKSGMWNITSFTSSGRYHLSCEACGILHHSLVLRTSTSVARHVPQLRGMWNIQSFTIVLGNITTVARHVEYYTSHQFWEISPQLRGMWNITSFSIVLGNITSVIRHVEYHLGHQATKTQISLIIDSMFCCIMLVLVVHQQI